MWLLLDKINFVNIVLTIFLTLLTNHIYKIHQNKKQRRNRFKSLIILTYFKLEPLDIVFQKSFSHCYIDDITKEPMIRFLTEPPKFELTDAQLADWSSFAKNMEFVSLLATLMAFCNTFTKSKDVHNTGYVLPVAKAKPISEEIGRIMTVLRKLYEYEFNEKFPIPSFSKVTSQ